MVSSFVQSKTCGDVIRYVSENPGLSTFDVATAMHSERKMAYYTACKVIYALEDEGVIRRVPTANAKGGMKKLVYLCGEIDTDGLSTNGNEA